MYRFRFGNLFALLDEIKIKNKGRLGSQTKLYAALVNPNNEGGISIDTGDVGKLAKGKFAPSGYTQGVINDLTVNELTQNYLSNLIPALNQSLLKPLILAIKSILESDTTISPSQTFAVDDCRKDSIINDTVIFLARLLACLVKETISQPNDKYDNEELLPKDYVKSFVNDNRIDKIKIVNKEEDVLTPLEKTLFTNNFNKIFEEVNPNSYSLNISNTNRFKVYVLDIYKKKSFETQHLVNFIIDNIGAYVRSRTYVKDSKDDGTQFSLGHYAINEIRARTTDKTEAFSQIMTYAFMESVLHAPKIFSTYELEHGLSGDKVSKVSGVYLLPYGSVEGYANQLVFGSSNVKNSITTAIDNVLEIASYIDKNESEMRRHIHNNIFYYGNSFNEETKSYLKSVLIPDKDNNNSIPKINSFGIFFSYSVDLSLIETNNIHQIKKEVCNLINNDIQQSIPYIEIKIKSLGLDTYPFYFFVLPLVDAEEVSSEIMDKVLG